MRYTNDEPDSDSETTFRLESDKKNCTTPIAKINLSRIDINFIIDTGTSVNIINRSMYHKISHQPLERNSPNIYAYNSKEKLPVYGKFKGRFRYKNNEIIDDVIVVDGNGEALLSCEAAQKLRLIEFCNMVGDCKYLQEFEARFPTVFTGVGNLKDYKVVYT